MVVMACQEKREELKISLAHLRDTHDGFCELLSHCLGMFFKTGREVFRKVRSKKPQREWAPVHNCWARGLSGSDGLSILLVCKMWGGGRMEGGVEKRAEKRGYKLWREITAFISKWQLFIFLPQAYLLTSHSVRICWSRRGRLRVLVVHEALILSLLEFRRLPVSNQPPNGQEAPLGMGIWQGLSKLSGSSRGFFILLLLP